MKVLQVVEDDAQIIPVKYILMSKAEFKQKVVDPFAGVVWDLKTVAKRMNRTPNWVRQQILYIPRFKEMLATKNGGPVSYSNGSGSNWRFEPHRWCDFIEDHYHEINWAAPEVRNKK